MAPGKKRKKSQPILLLTRRQRSKTRRRNQQRFAVLPLAILPEKAWFARGEDASTTNATMHASTLPLHPLASTEIMYMKLKNTIRSGQHGPRQLSQNPAIPFQLWWCFVGLNFSCQLLMVPTMYASLTSKLREHSPSLS